MRTLLSFRSTSVMESLLERDMLAGLGWVCYESRSFIGFLMKLFVNYYFEDK